MNLMNWQKTFNQMSQSLKESHEEIERQEERRRQFMADALP